ncbi:anoctamin-like protein At1g73020 isoform X2 [Euphorbia lathyris]|uniref:anoctamin-like protein At1g73020 isoform X2 n=1 Tax=Euphorbia lathyris TaxID=212925 RepID=UPI00331435AC
MGFSEFILLRFGFLEVLTDRSRLFVEAFSGHLEVRSIFFLTRRGKRKGYGLTVIYLVVIQYFKKIGGKISMKLIQHENNENTEYQADSLVYKVFGLYSMQSYIGVFYHALHRNFMSLRQVLIQRLIVCQVGLSNSQSKQPNPLLNVLVQKRGFSWT